MTMRMSPRGLALALLAGALAAVTPFATPVIWGVGAVLAAALLLVVVLLPGPTPASPTRKAARPPGAKKPPSPPRRAAAKPRTGARQAARR